VNALKGFKTGGGRDLEACELKLDIEDQRLWSGDQAVPLGNKAFQLLQLFVENPGRLLTKDQILEALWTDVYVSEGLIKEYVHDLRLALGDDPKEPRFIETVRGRGYRFLGGITPVAGPEKAETRTFPEKPSIAVLPFTNISGDPAEEYFADGLSEEIITALSFVPWLFVIARNSSFIYKGKTIDVRQVGRNLGVGYVLEGSVRRAGNRLRVNGQLVETENANHIWAGRFQADLEDVFDLQDEITEAVVTAIGPEIQLAEIGRAVRKHPTSLTAYDVYLRARAALNSLQIDAAIELLDEAIANAPDYAKAKAVRAWCTTLIGWQFVAPSEAQRKLSLRLAEEALASPEADAEVRAYAGYTIGFMSDQKDRAIALVEEVTRQCPSFAWAWASLALLESYHGDARRAIHLAKTSLRLNPSDPQSFRCEMAISKAYLILGRFEDSLNYACQGLQKSPRNTFFQMCRITSLVRLGRTEEACTVAQSFKTQNPDFRVSKWRDLTRNWAAWTAMSPVLQDALRSVGIPA
jgi:adenylate cyclase